MMNKKTAIALALLAIPTFTTPAFMKASPMDKIPKCTVSENFSEADIKYLGNGIFLDANGYQVEPCLKGDTVYFPIISKVKDGVEIFKKAEGKILHQEPPKKEEAGYTLSYGDGSYEVEDVEGFREQAKAKALGSPEIPNTKLTIEDVLEVLAIPDNLEMPLELQNSIAPEKQARLQEDYSKIMADTTTAHESLVRTIYEDLINLFAKNNRLYLSQQISINQYGTQEYDASGIAYAVFDARLSASDFLNGYIVAVNKLATGDSLDERLKIIEYVKEQEPLVLAGKYAAKKVDKLQIELMSDPAAVELRGREMLAKAAPEDKAAFFEIVSAANEKILWNEYEDMPEEITKKQYKALSDVDKSKYAPVRSGQYVDHNRYRKLPKNKVINRDMSKKAE